MNLGKYAGTIVVCYALVSLVMAGLAAWLVADGRRLTRQLAALEARGVRRRSMGTSGTADAAAAPEPNTRT